MERALTHSVACTAGARPISAKLVTKKLVVKPAAAQRAQRLSVRVTNVASFAAPGSNSVERATAPEVSPIVDVRVDEAIGAVKWLLIPSPEAFRALMDSNPDKLVILMCKATGCRPCKAFRSKYAKLALHYNDAIFCEILGDRSEATRGMMRSLKVKATPTFIFFRNGESVHMHSGINGQKMIDALKVAVRPSEAGFCEEVKFAAALLSSDEH